MKLTTGAFAKVIVLAAALPMTSLYAQAAEPAAMPMNHAAATESKVSHGMEWSKPSTPRQVQSL